MFDLTHMILDGANGTELQRRGMPPGVCSEQWILEHPEAQQDIQRRYVAAGSTAVLAPTFGANGVALSRHGHGERVREYNLRLVALSREAVGGKALIGGDISPTGLCCGVVEPALYERVLAVYREQVSALEEAGVDFYMVETQISLPEAHAAVTAVKEISRKPVFASFSMAGGGRTFAGGDVACALLTLEKLGIDAFGINCVDDPAVIAATLKRLRALTALPLLVQANAGLPETVDGRAVYSVTAETMAADALVYYEAGADIFGACCGSHDGHIGAIARAVGSLPWRSHGNTEGEYACSEYVLTDLKGAVRAVEVRVDENWEATLEKAEEQEADLLCLHIENEAQLEVLLRQADKLRTPLSLRFADSSFREKFEKVYVGVAEFK